MRVSLSDKGSKLTRRRPKVTQAKLISCSYMLKLSLQAQVLEAQAHMLSSQASSFKTHTQISSLFFSQDIQNLSQKALHTSFKQHLNIHTNTHTNPLTTNINDTFI